MAQCQKHTHRTCLVGPHHKNWVKAEFTQLDTHNAHIMYGNPFPSAPLAQLLIPFGTIPKRIVGLSRRTNE
jgi:hypothetical protein